MLRRWISTGVLTAVAFAGAPCQQRQEAGRKTGKRPAPVVVKKQRTPSDVRWDRPDPKAAAASDRGDKAKAPSALRLRLDGVDRSCCCGPREGCGQQTTVNLHLRVPSAGGGHEENIQLGQKLSWTQDASSRRGACELTLSRPPASGSYLDGLSSGPFYWAPKKSVAVATTGTVLINALPQDWYVRVSGEDRDPIEGVEVQLRSPQAGAVGSGGAAATPIVAESKAQGVARLRVPVCPRLGAMRPRVSLVPGSAPQYTPSQPDGVELRAKGIPTGGPGELDLRLVASHAVRRVFIGWPGESGSSQPTPGEKSLPSTAALFARVDGGDPEVLEDNQELTWRVGARVSLEVRGSDSAHISSVRLDSRELKARDWEHGFDWPKTGGNKGKSEDTGVMLYVEIDEPCRNVERSVPVVSLTDCRKKPILPRSLRARDDSGSPRPLPVSEDGKVTLRMVRAVGPSCRASRLPAVEVPAGDPLYDSGRLAWSDGGTELDARPLARFPRAYLLVDISSTMGNYYFDVQKALGKIARAASSAELPEYVSLTAAYGALHRLSNSTTGMRDVAATARWLRNELEDGQISSHGAAPASLLLSLIKEHLGRNGHPGGSLLTHHVIYVGGDTALASPEELRLADRLAAGRLPGGTRISVVLLSSDGRCTRAAVRGDMREGHMRFHCVRPGDVPNKILSLLKEPCAPGAGR